MKGVLSTTVTHYKNHESLIGHFKNHWNALKGLAEVHVQSSAQEVKHRAVIVVWLISYKWRPCYWKITFKYSCKSIFMSLICQISHKLHVSTEGVTYPYLFTKCYQYFQNCTFLPSRCLRCHTHNTDLLQCIH